MQRRYDVIIALLLRHVSPGFVRSVEWQEGWLKYWTSFTNASQVQCFIGGNKKENSHKIKINKRQQLKQQNCEVTNHLMWRVASSGLQMATIQLGAKPSAVTWAGISNNYLRKLQIQVIKTTWLRVPKYITTLFAVLNRTKKLQRNHFVDILSLVPSRTGSIVMQGRMINACDCCVQIKTPR